MNKKPIVFKRFFRENRQHRTVPYCTEVYRCDVRRNSAAQPASQSECIARWLGFFSFVVHNKVFPDERHSGCWKQPSLLLDFHCYNKLRNSSFLNYLDDTREKVSQSGINLQNVDTSVSLLRLITYGNSLKWPHESHTNLLSLKLNEDLLASRVRLYSCTLGGNSLVLVAQAFHMKLSMMVGDKTFYLIAPFPSSFVHIWVLLWKLIMVLLVREATVIHCNFQIKWKRIVIL